MQTPPIASSARSRGPDVPLDQIAKRQGLTQEERVGAASRAFEAVFLRQILDSAQKTVIPSALSQETSSAAVYRDLVNDTLAQRIASSGQFGLASTLVADWNRYRPAKESQAGGPSPEPAPAFAATPEAALAAVPPSAPSRGLKPFRKTPDFKPGSPKSHL